MADVIPLEAAEARERLRPIAWSEIGSLPKRKTLVKRLLESTALSVIYGESNCGKSFFAVDMAIYIARGVQWRDRRVKQHPVVYLCAEGGLGIEERLTAYQYHHNINPADVPLYIIPAGADLCTAPTDANIIIGQIEAMEIEPGQIVIDTLAATFGGGNENAPDDMNAFLCNVMRIREATGAHVMIVHHCGKDTARGARGHSSLRAATDSEIEIVADGEGNRTATVTKQRDGATGDEFHFRLDVIDIGQDEDGDSVTSCVVVPAEQGPGRQRNGAGPRLSPKEKRAMAVLHDCRVDAGQTAPNTNHYPPGAIVVKAETWRTELIQRGVLSSDNPDTASRQWRRIREGLMDKEKVAEYGGLLWVVE